MAECETADKRRLLSSPLLPVGSLRARVRPACHRGLSIWSWLLIRFKSRKQKFCLLLFEKFVLKDPGRLILERKAVFRKHLSRGWNHWKVPYHFLANLDKLSVDARASGWRLGNRPRSHARPSAPEQGGSTELIASRWGGYSEPPFINTDTETVRSGNS